jgi:plastocyanin
VFTYQTASGLNAPLAASGDYLFVPAGGPLMASEDTWDPAPTPQAELIALKIGGEIQTVPTGTPVPDEATPAAEASAGEGVQVSAVDIAFEPKELTISANTDVVVTITNNGALQHDFTIDELGVKSDLLGGGESTEVTINAAAGTYEYYCSVTGHREAGMVGTLTVE